MDGHDDPVQIDQIVLAQLLHSSLIGPFIAAVVSLYALS
jgi:hypothetical protein